jgi:S-adenosylmethionine hydrolase
MPFENTFGGVSVGMPLAYLNSLMNVAVALNQGSFANKHHIQAGNDWNISISWVK